MYVCAHGHVHVCLCNIIRVFFYMFNSFVQMRVCVFAGMHVFINMYICMYACIHVYLFLCFYVCLYACMHGYTYVCVCLF